MHSVRILALFYMIQVSGRQVGEIASGNGSNVYGGQTGDERN
jgi:hypothetical protein